MIFGNIIRINIFIIARRKMWCEYACYPMFVHLWSNTKLQNDIYNTFVALEVVLYTDFNPDCTVSQYKLDNVNRFINFFLEFKKPNNINIGFLFVRLWYCRNISFLTFLFAYGSQSQNQMP